MEYGEGGTSTRKGDTHKEEAVLVEEAVEEGGVEGGREGRRDQGMG